MKVQSTLKAEELSKSFGSSRVVNDVSFAVNTGEVVGLFGPNGAGKTTTFYAVVGFIRPDAGKIIVDDEEVTSLPMFMRARKGYHLLTSGAFCVQEVECCE